MARTVQAAKRYDMLELVKTVFEPQLIALGLSEDQIGRQTQEELEQSLERVNEAIQHPDSFGRLGLNLSSAAGWYITSGDSDANVKEVNILPLLLERKKLILERLRGLHIDEELAKAQKATRNATLDDVGEDEKRRAEEWEANLKKQQEQLQKSAEAQKMEELKANLARAELQARAEIEMKKARARSEIWLSFLARESVATIVGGFLLILIIIILLIAMFFKLATPDIINNSFLVILGYFFGQATGRILPHVKTKDDGSRQEDDPTHTF